MNMNLTEIAFILDRSGSMGHLTESTISGFNEFLEKQKNLPGEAKLTTVLFDNAYELLHNAVDIKEVRPLTTNEYWTRGCTALYDAVGKTIDDIGVRLAATPEEERPSKVIVVITTDGYENASCEYSQADVKNKITHQTEKYSWEFIFLGANIDSEEVASNIGICSANTADYIASDAGAFMMFSAVDAAVKSVRSTGSVSADWSDSLNDTSDATLSSAKSYTDADAKVTVLSTDADGIITSINDRNVISSDNDRNTILSKTIVTPLE